MVNLNTIASPASIAVSFDPYTRSELAISVVRDLARRISKRCATRSSRIQTPDHPLHSNNIHISQTTTIHTPPNHQPPKLNKQNILAFPITSPRKPDRQPPPTIPPHRSHPLFPPPRAHPFIRSIPGAGCRFRIPRIGSRVVAL